MLWWQSTWDLEWGDCRCQGHGEIAAGPWLLTATSGTETRKWWYWSRVDGGKGPLFALAKLGCWWHNVQRLMPCILGLDKVSAYAYLPRDFVITEMVGEEIKRWCSGITKGVWSAQVTPSGGVGGDTSSGQNCVNLLVNFYIWIIPQCYISLMSN